MQLTLKNYYSEIDGLSFNIKNPGDWFSLRFFIVNGKIDAKLEEITEFKPICTSSTVDKEDDQMICENLQIEYIYLLTNLVFLI